MNRAFLFALLFEVCLLGCQKKYQVQVEGVITSGNTGLPIENATVYLESSSLTNSGLRAEVLSSTQTDAEGYYYVSSKVEEPCGALRIRPESEGYESFAPLGQQITCSDGLQQWSHAIDSCFQFNPATGMFENTGFTGCD